MDFFAFYRSYTLLLETGAEIKINTPKSSNFYYQIGDGEILQYDEFKASIGYETVTLDSNNVEQTVLNEPDAQNPFSVSFVTPFLRMIAAELPVFSVSDSQVIRGGLGKDIIGAGGLAE